MLRCWKYRVLHGRQRQIWQTALQKLAQGWVGGRGRERTLIDLVMEQSDTGLQVVNCCLHVVDFVGDRLKGGWQSSLDVECGFCRYVHQASHHNPNSRALSRSRQEDKVGASLNIYSYILYYPEAEMFSSQ